jgi:hypothetical protein
LLAALPRPAAFREVVDIRYFEALAEHGKLALLLNGWNEPDERMSDQGSAYATI